MNQSSIFSFCTVRPLGSYPNPPLKCLPLQSSTTMFISKAFVFFFALLVCSVIAAPVITERSLDELELLPRAGRLDRATVAIVSKIRNVLRPKPGGAVFWSGSAPGKGGKNVSVKKQAEKFAKKNDKETIGQAMKRTDIKIPKNNKWYKPLWEMASNVFAKHSKGDTHAILGSKRTPGNIYERIEKPTLMNNSKVTKLTEHNVATGESAVVKDSSKKRKVSFFLNVSILTHTRFIGTQP